MKLHTKSVENVGNKVSDNARIRTIIYSYNNTICSNDVQEITKRVKDMVELDSAVNGMNEKDALVNEFKQYVLGRARTRCLPTTLIFIMYKKWHQKKHSDQQPYGKNQFFDAMNRLTNPAVDRWYYAPKQERIKDLFDWNDPLLKEFRCAEWVAKHKEDKFARGLFRIDC